MFECSRCTTRSLRALLQDAPNHIRLAGRAALQRPAILHQQRRTIALTSQHASRDDDSVPFDKEVRDLPISPVPQRHLELELKWLKDKVKLAEHVKSLVQKNNDLDKALALVRQASRSEHNGNTVVAWNHILKYVLDRGETEKAFSIYNDMKKRAQFPDSHTYLIMLKGYGITKNTIRRPSARDISRVLSIYNSMKAPNSRVKPTIIHTNAALQACSLVQDMDSVWSILAQMDEEGPNASDYITFTVILNAIRMSALKDLDGNTNLEQVRRLKFEAAQQAREIWMDVVKKWRNGKIQMDERLVIAMAQVLLFSPSLQDWDDVLNLMMQTMDIPRVIEPLSSKTRQTGHVPDQEQYRSRDTAHQDAFQPLESDHTTNVAKKDRKIDTFKYARPGAGTLAVMLETCFVMRTPKAALETWVLLTQRPFNVRPDLANLEALLRICSVNRSSATASRMLEEVSEQYKLEPRSATIAMAMQACARNNQNKECVQHAAKIVDAMEKYIKRLDMPIIMQYLSLAVHTGDVDIITSTVDHLYALLQRLKKQVNAFQADAAMISGAAALAQGLVGAMDTAKSTASSSSAADEPWTERRVELTRLITLWTGNLRAIVGRHAADSMVEDMLQRPSGQGRPRAGRTDYPTDRFSNRHTTGRRSAQDSSRRNTRSPSRQVNMPFDRRNKASSGTQRPSMFTNDKRRSDDAFKDSPAEMTI